MDLDVKFCLRGKTIQ